MFLRFWSRRSLRGFVAIPDGAWVSIFWFGSRVNVELGVWMSVLFHLKNGVLFS